MVDFIRSVSRSRRCGPAPRPARHSWRRAVSPGRSSPRAPAGQRPGGGPWFRATGTGVTVVRPAVHVGPWRHYSRSRSILAALLDMLLDLTAHGVDGLRLHVARLQPLPKVCRRCGGAAALESLTGDTDQPQRDPAPLARRRRPTRLDWRRGSPALRGSCSVESLGRAPGPASPLRSLEPTPGGRQSGLAS